MSDIEFTQSPNFVEYSYKTKIGKQTLLVNFSGHFGEPPIDKISWWVYANLYNKRKDMDKNLSEHKVTGKGLLALITIKNAIEEFEKMIIEEYPCLSHIICVGWEDNRRRNIYARTLLRNGYVFGMSETFERKKVLYKNL